MRIGMISPPWLAVPPKGYGGVEWVVSLLADGLADRGHDVTLFATGDSQTRARLEYVFQEAPGASAINSVWHDALQTLHAYRDPTRFDLIHDHTQWSGLVAASTAEVPVVHTLHGQFSPPMRRLYEAVADRLWFVAISENQRSHMPDLRYAGVVYNGIDLDRYAFREEKEDFLLFLGRTNPDKGPVRAIEAARAVGLPLTMAVKVAQPEEVRHWQDDIEPLLGDDITILHELEHGPKADLLARAKAVLFPIDWPEPFGLVMTEAMACGTPVIATPRGSVPEVVADGETGFVVSVEGYAEEAAAALARLGEIDHKACRARVEQRFSKDAMVGGYASVYERIIEEAKR